MKTLSRWIAHLTVTPLAVLALQGVVLDARAFTDTNEEMRHQPTEQRAVAGARAPAVKPVQVVWVPPTAKSLDGFRPVLPPDRSMVAARPQAQPQVQTVAKADAR